MYNQLVLDDYQTKLSPVLTKFCRPLASRYLIFRAPYLLDNISENMIGLPTDFYDPSHV